MKLSKLVFLVAVLWFANVSVTLAGENDGPDLSMCNPYGWRHKGDMFLEFQNDFNAYAKASYDCVRDSSDGEIYYKNNGWKLWRDVENAHPAVDMDGDNFAAQTYKDGTAFITFITTNAKWKWLHDYITSVYGTTIPTSMVAYWRANVVAFFFSSPSSLPNNYTADFSAAGAYSAFQAAWGHTFCDPTATITYVLTEGSVTNDYGWKSGEEMRQALLADCRSIGEQADVLTLLQDDSFSAKWGWFKTYLSARMAQQLGKTATEAWAYMLANPAETNRAVETFFTVDITNLSLWQSYWKHGFDNPIRLAQGETFKLNAPYKPVGSFRGWYLDAEGKGQVVTEVNVGHMGRTLYTVWNAYVPKPVDPTDKVTVYEGRDGNMDTKAVIPTPNDRIVLSYTSLHYDIRPVMDYTTHMCVSCANPVVEDGKYVRFELVNGSYGQTRFAKIVALKQKKPDLKILLSFGNAGSAFSIICASEQMRHQFAEDCLTFCQENNLDGIDLDWEFPGFGTGTDPLHDVDNFTLLVKELRKVMGNQYLITLAGAIDDKQPVSGGGYRYIDLPACEPYLNYINLMNYDFASAPSPHNAIEAKGHYWDVLRTWNNYVKAGFPAEKLVMGVAFYGRHSFDATVTDGGEMFYSKIETMLKQYPSIYTSVYNETWQVPVLYKNNTMYCSYDNPYSIVAKGNWALERGMLGIMHWQVAGDNKTTDLQRACWQAMRKQAAITFKDTVRTISLTDSVGQISDTVTVTLRSSSNDIVTRVICSRGSRFPVDAVANEGGVFSGWSDGVTEASRTIVANGDLTLTAYFNLPTALDRLSVSPQITKVIRDGHLYICRDGKCYDTAGAVVR